MTEVKPLTMCLNCQDFATLLFYWNW